MPSPDSIIAFDTDYASVKRHISALPQDVRVVLLVTALDAAPRPLRSASLLNNAKILTQAGQAFKAEDINANIEILVEEGVLVQPDRKLIVDPLIELPTIMAAYASAPAQGKLIAKGLIGITSYNSAHQNIGASAQVKYRDWNKLYDYDGYPGFARLLMLADDFEAFQVEISGLRDHHEWRVPARKQEAMRAAIEPYIYFDYEFFGHLDPQFRSTAFEFAMGPKARWSAATATAVAAYLCDTSFTSLIREPHIEMLMSRGACLAGHEYAKHKDAWHLYPRAGVIGALVAGDDAIAERLAKEILPLNAQAFGLGDFVSILLGFRQNELDSSRLDDRMRRWRKGQSTILRNIFQAFMHWKQGDAEAAEQLLLKNFGIKKAEQEDLEVVSFEQDPYPIEWALALCVYAWTGLRPNIAALDGFLRKLEMRQDVSDASVAHQPYLKGELMNALTHALPGDPRARAWREEAEAIAEQYNFHYLLRLQPVPEPWEYAVRVILSVANTEHTDSTKKQNASRLVWIVDFDTQELFVRQQTRGKRGWSKGKKLSPQALVELAGTGEFTAEDDRVIGIAERYDHKPVTIGQRYGTDVEFNFGKALYYLDGHPRLYVDDLKRIPLELVRSKPQMLVEESGDMLRLSFIPASAPTPGFHWEKETPTRYRVYEVSAEQARLSRAIGRETLIPNDKRERIDEKLDDLRDHVTVTAPADLDGEDLTEVQGDTRPCAQLLPYGVAYKLELYSRPLPQEELYLRIGQGQSRSAVMRRLGGEFLPEELADAEDNDADLLQNERVLLIRDLAAEQRAAEAVIRDCPTLGILAHADYEWTLDDDFAALRVLLELRSLQQEERLSIEHPKGEKLRLVGSGSTDNLRIQVRKERDWFEVSGNLVTDEGKVVSFQQLLAHLRNGGGEFVELSEGEFMAITEELRSRLEAMEGMLQKREGQLVIPTLAAPAFADMLEDLEDVEVDDAWRQNLARIAASKDFSPTLPPDFQGELRDYQVAGYSWLRRLAEWQVGGCLADDMGLGKTVQALALLVSRQQQGPALVIAPASVTRNWLAETARFAPTLTPKLLATSTDVEVLEDLQPGDLLMVSYGLLTFVEDALMAISFSTIVLDEAQAIKNPATKRAKLIFKLDGELRIATTGTPIENHLGELWSLFRFLNPGLLGSRASFNEKYAGPIRREGDSTRAEALRRLVRPFILRRRKEEVLKELPPKTEVNLSVELSAEERALYEALRREAVDAIDDASPNAQRMIVLQQLTRLRQAACHPRLVRPKSTIPSAKLELVGQTILELIETGHKALIFSQFVRHLKLVKEWVESQGIKHCYLDGSTPGGKRQAQVDQFQNGEADLFLISLKAGGTGLNLTEADYVLHLDPWWNPAAEDQASDRAHRIGQQRPVTVYRFVSEGTIEERILALHAEKRNLADQILMGTDAGGKLSVNEVVALLNEEI